MSVLRRAAGSATDFACRAAGRRNVVRATRFMLYRARRDVPNDMRTNGEFALQRWIVSMAGLGQKLQVVDVGANVGRWSAAMLAAARCASREQDLDLRVFEPAGFTYGRLAAALHGQPVILHHMAVGDQVGTCTLHVFAPGAGTNSLHRIPDAPAGSKAEEVPVTTLTEYADTTGLDHVTLVKIDTEGHDLAVLRGARALFARQRISVAQFEYNHRWIYARCYLRDAFDLLQPLGYQIGKLTPFGVEFYPGWHSELETFIEGNYVACHASVAARLPTVTWWKDASVELAG